MSKIATPLSRKAMLVAVNISQWSARKLDKRVTDETNQKYNAAKDAGRYNKLLIAAEHLEELTGLVSRVRLTHYKLTLPWNEDGTRILANAHYAKFTDEFRAIKREFEAAADKFARGYPRFVQERAAKLNGLFNPNDYPHPDTIRSKFKMDLTVLPFPDVDDFRADLDDDTVADIKAELAETSRNVVDQAMKHTAQKIIDTVGHMADRLGKYKASEKRGDKAEGVFRDSLVENVRELADLLAPFNLTDDPQFDVIINRIKNELCVEDANELRKNDAARANVQKSADEIVAAVGNLFA